MALGSKSSCGYVLLASLNGERAAASMTLRWKADVVVADITRLLFRPFLTDAFMVDGYSLDNINLLKVPFFGFYLCV